MPNLESLFKERESLFRRIERNKPGVTALRYRLRQVTHEILNFGLCK